MNHVYKLHGIPSVIISDRDKVFTALFWKELFSLAGVTLNMSSAYHPQTDGQTERVNQCMETFLRCFAHACPGKWSQWLASAEFWYNTCQHSSLGMSPFQALYGYTPRYFGIDHRTDISHPDLEIWLTERELMNDVIKQHLNRAQQCMKDQVDKNRSEHQFKENDLVFLKLQPYVQSSVARRANHKLSFKFFGPFRIIQKVGEVAYKLQLPPGASIHPVFHVSQLKKAMGTNHQVCDELPVALSAYQVPMEVLEYRNIQQGNAMVKQVLVRWSDSPLGLSTWEDEAQLKQRFPRAAAWGQATSQEGGMLVPLIMPRTVMQLREASVTGSQV